ncbi:TPA: fimbrial protein [Escherichia coli]|nr:fimbrial protein [Escherichia coli]HAN6242102.1 fimbrial protein [Escherichia coli]HAN6313563.1 fimbrial protein [Escherichia coli]HAN6407217.1 fimbrial protein [Escherichia coli]HAN6432834.1 fimbrial protein [Escherichia coli]
MKLKAIAILIVTGGMISHSALAGTTSATLTVDSIVTMGTCTAQLLDSNDKEISQVAIGDVYISELRNETNKKAFKIRFSGCAGLPQKKALVKLTPRGIGCGGYNANSAGFVNAKNGAGAAGRVAVEVWSTQNAEIEAGSEIFNCFSPADKTVNLSSVTATQHFDYDLSAKMVVAEGRQLSDVTPGEFLSPATFTISYQ